MFKGGQQGDNTRTAGKAIGNLIPWTLPSYSIPVLVPSPIKRPPPRQRKNGLIPRTSWTSQGRAIQDDLFNYKSSRHPERKKKICQKLSYITYVYSLEFHSSNPKPLSGFPPPSLRDYGFTTSEQGCCLPGNLMANPLPLPYKSLP